MPFEPFPSSTIEEMAAILRRDRPIDPAVLVDDLNELQQEMVEYDAAVRQAQDEEDAPNGPSRQNLAKLYKRMAAHLSKLRQEIQHLSVADEGDASVYYKARRQLIARLRKLAARRSRRPKVPPITLTELQLQIQLMEDAVASLHADHARGQKGTNKQHLDEEYLLRLEDIYCHHTGRDYAGVGPRSRFVKFAAIAFAHNWPAWARAGGAHKAISRRLEAANHPDKKLGVARRRTYQEAPE